MRVIGNICDLISMTFKMKFAWRLKIILFHFPLFCTYNLILNFSPHIYPKFLLITQPNLPQFYLCFCKFFPSVKKTFKMRPNMPWAQAKSRGVYMRLEKQTNKHDMIDIFLCFFFFFSAIFFNLSLCVCNFLSATHIPRDNGNNNRALWRKKIIVAQSLLLVPPVTLSVLHNFSFLVTEI